MYLGKKVTLVFPAFNEEKNIGQALDDFKKLHIFDEILVIDNNSKDQTAKIASKRQAKVIIEKRQGYGFALRRGMKEAHGDYIFLCEPDGTFLARDTLRLIKYLETHDMVIGTRTNLHYISKKANMHGLLRWGNIILAKFIQLLYLSKSSLSDCGCTFRVIKKSSVKKLLPHFSVGGSYFLAELLTLALVKKLTFLEIPVHYRERIGESKITGSLKKAIIVGIQMFNIILTYRFTK